MRQRGSSPRPVSACLSVCLSHSCIVSKRLKIKLLLYSTAHALCFCSCIIAALGLYLEEKKKNIYFANSKNNYNTNIICKHRGGFPEGQSPIVLDNLAMLNITSNIKKKQFTIYYRSTLMNIHLYTNVIKKVLFTYYTQHKV